MNRNPMMKLVLLLSVTALAFMSSCDVLDDFEDETYEMEAFDADAASSLRATMKKELFGSVKLHNNPDSLDLEFLHTILSLEDTLIHVEGSDTTIYPPTTDYIFTANELLLRLDTMMVFDTTFVNDSTFTIDTSEVVEQVESYTKQLGTANATHSYFVLEGVNTGDVVFYFDDYIRTQVYDFDVSAEPLEVIDETIPLELSSGLFTITNRVARPVVKSRYAYELQANKSYLITIQKLEQTLGTKYNAVIINK
jgi:hypothetical protein